MNAAQARSEDFEAKSQLLWWSSFMDNLRLQSHMQSDSAGPLHCSLKLSMRRGPP